MLTILRLWIWCGMYVSSFACVYAQAKLDSLVRVPSVPSYAVHAIVHDRAGKAWIATQKGLYCLIKDKKVPQLFLKDIGCHRLLLRGDTLWVGTYIQGVYALPLSSPDKPQVYPFPPDSNPSLINDMLFVQDSLWLATANQGVFSVNKGANPPVLQSIHEEFGETNKNVYALLPQGDKVWIGTQTKIFAYILSNGNITSQPIGQVLKLFSQKDTLWASTIEQGGRLTRLLPNAKNWERFESEKTESQRQYLYNDFAQNTQGVWIASRKLLQYDNKRLRFHAIDTLEKQDKDCLLTCLSFENDSILWVGTNRLGVWKVNTRQLQKRYHKSVNFAWEGKTLNLKDTLNLNIKFKGDGIDLTKKAKKELKKIITFLLEYPELNVQVLGFTALNSTILAEGRARNVENYLKTQINDDRFLPIRGFAKTARISVQIVLQDY